jgi:hypothetical protein
MRNDSVPQPDEDNVIHVGTDLAAANRQRRAERRDNTARAELEAMMSADLAGSGLTLAHARKLGFELKAADELWRLLRPKRPERPSDFTAEGYVIPYFGPDKKKIPYARAKKLIGSWGKDHDDAHTYTQPLNSLPHPYLPAPLAANWMARGKDGRIAVRGKFIIVEGEKKIIKATLCGLNGIGIGGVHAFRAGKHGILLLPEILNWFDLSQADVIVVYDSDAYTNPVVQCALRALSDAIRRFAHPRSLKQKRLTHENVGDKTGLDDFLLQYKTAAAALRAFDELEGVDDPMSEAFATFNRELVHVRKKTAYYNVTTDTLYPSQQKVIEEYGARSSPILDVEGKKEVCPIKVWMSQRPPETEVLDVLYTPGKPERYPSARSAGDVMNKWRPGPLGPT